MKIATGYAGLNIEDESYVKLMRYVLIVHSLVGSVVMMIHHLHLQTNRQLNEIANGLRNLKCSNIVIRGVTILL